MFRHKKLAEALRAQAEEVRALREELARQNALNQQTVAIGLREAERARADALGAQVARRRRGPDDGSLARW